MRKVEGHLDSYVITDKRGDLWDESGYLLGFDDQEIVLTVETATEHAAREEALRVVCEAAMNMVPNYAIAGLKKEADATLAAIAALKEKP